MSNPNYLLRDGWDADCAAPVPRHGDFSGCQVRGHQMVSARASTGRSWPHASRDSRPYLGYVTPPFRNPVPELCPPTAITLAETTCTETADGRVRHLLVELHDGTFFRAPVKIIPPRSGMGAMARPHPQRHASGYVYALPGGKEIEA